MGIEKISTAGPVRTVLIRWCIRIVRIRHTLFETANGFSKPRSDLGKSSNSKHNKNNYEYDNDLWKTQTEHRRPLPWGINQYIYSSNVLSTDAVKTPPPLHGPFQDFQSGYTDLETPAGYSL
jgi:hypothetical protein